MPENNAEYASGVGQDDKVDRRWVCSSCDSIVHARWFGRGSFAVGCDCKTVPVVPQMGQDETPDCWHVERPECCRGVEVKALDPIYGERWKDYECPDCGAEYSWDGKMVAAPSKGQEATPDEDQHILTDGGEELESEVYRDPTPVEVGEILFELDVGQELRFEFEWDGVTYSESGEVTVNEPRNSTSMGTDPGDTPDPHDIYVMTVEETEFRFTTASFEGRHVGGMFGEVSDLERRKADEERATPLNGSKVTRLEVQG